MDMMPEAMNARLLSLLLLASTISILHFSCASRNKPDTGTTNPEISESFIPRPYLERAVPRPLGRILISWQPVESATGYQLQMSYDADFSEIEKSWTIRGVSLELPVDPEDILLFRIRAFNSDTTSRWSPSLEVRGSRL